MTIYFAKGAYFTPACTVRLASRSVKPIIVNNFPVAFEQDANFEGYLYRTPDVINGVSDLSFKMLLLEQAMAIPNEDVGLAYAGGRTQHWLSVSGAIGGVFLKSFAFQDTPLHLATEVKWNATFSATYNNAALTRNIVELDEQVTVNGEGGAVTVLAPQAGLKSIYQDISDFSDVQIIQSGRITGKSAMPGLPLPIITVPGARDVRATRDSPSFVKRGLHILLYVREYQYTFNLAEHPGGVVLPTRLES
jgi:hypothetical protein